MILGEKISIYRNQFDSTSKYTISVQDALQRIRTGKSEKQIIDLRMEANEDRQREIKSRLPAVTWSGIFDTRTDNAIKTHSGLICLDFDHVDVQEYRNKFKAWKYTLACWVSPRGNGLKVLVRISSPENHRLHFEAIREIYPNTDKQCINVSRLCFESYDPDLYVNESAEVFTKIIKVEKVESKVSADLYKVFKNLQRWLEKSGEAFTSGNRNAYIFKLASAMCRYGVAQDETVSLLLGEYSEPGFNAKEIERTVHSAYKANASKRGSVEFSNDVLVEKRTTHQIDPAVLHEGAKPKDVIYGIDVYDGAYNIYLRGYESAETTHIPQLDEYFKFKRGELTLLTGIGNYGKTNYLNQLFLIKSYFSGTKWATFSPENFPAHEYYLDLAEMLLGCRADGGAIEKPKQNIFEDAYQFVSEHFYYVYPQTIAPTPDYIKTKFMELIIKEKIDGVLIDPFNQLTNDYNSTHGRDDKYLETFLSDCKRFAQENNIYFFIIAHPHKLQKGTNGNYPCPDVFELAGGAMWNNKCDNILAYHRPLAQSDPENPLCEHHSKKIRRQKMIGKKGFFEFTLDRKRRRFIFGGKNPLDGNRFEAGIKEEPTYDEETPF